MKYNLSQDTDAILVDNHKAREDIARDRVTSARSRLIELYYACGMLFGDVNDTNLHSSEATSHRRVVNALDATRLLYEDAVAQGGKK